MSSPAQGASASPFPNFMQMPTILPGWAWDALRLFAMFTALAVAALLWQWPELGLSLFWGLIVPALPLMFMLTPGLWRNICPLASSNQSPRRLGLTRRLTQKSLPTGAAFPAGIGMFVAAILARKLVFSVSGPATAALIVGAMVSAFIGGVFFKGKSGWCSSICPLLPVQRLYGQTPFIKVANTHCEPCVGCAKNCYDFNPGEAYLADQYDADPRYREFRRFFAALFPGLILGFHLVPAADGVSASTTVLQMLLYMASSLTAFTLLDLLFGATPNRMPVICAALGMNLYYWFAAPNVLHTLEQLGVSVDHLWVGALRAAVAIATLVWTARSMYAERLFLAEQVRRSKVGEIHLAPVVVETVRIHRKIVSRPATDAPAAERQASSAGSIEGGAAAPRRLEPVASAPASAIAKPARAHDRGGRPELRIEPDGKCVPLKNGTSLLSVLEGCGAAIVAGCRAGACGADPIAVTGGADCLGAIGNTERSTLARLGHAPNTRMACMARVRKAGAVTVELKPHAARVIAPAAGQATTPARKLPVPTVDVDPTIRQVVVVGNGVAGLTAAETVRRHHPDCEIHMISRERYYSYNRMAVSALINQRAGLQGMGLRSEAWYAEQRVTQWLNTLATGIDTAARRVLLATGESLAYDRLILANGSHAWAPPIEGFGIPGSYVLREASDAMAIRAYAQQHGAERAIVVGAGLLGLEVAAELRKFGLQVQVLSLNDRVLDRQIDARASRMLVDHMRQQGIDLVTQASFRTLLSRGGRVCGGRLVNGRQLDADLVVACAGTRAELGLARSAGLATGRGILVDAQMRTSVAGIFAAGDVVEHEGQQSGLWSIAIAQGEVAARSALGLDARYEAIQPTTSLKMEGIEVRSAGVPNAQAPAQRDLLCLGPAGAATGDQTVGGPQYCKLIVERRTERKRRDRLVGAVIVGSHESADELLEAVNRRASLTSMRGVLNRHSWRVQPALSVLQSTRDTAAKTLCAAA